MTSCVPLARTRVCASPPDKLFEPFASGRPGGLGLGLYQARKSLNEAGGELRAEPSEAGLRFLLRMPARAP